MSVLGTGYITVRNIRSSIQIIVRSLHTVFACFRFASLVWFMFGAIWYEMVRENSTSSSEFRVPSSSNIKIIVTPRDDVTRTV
jgi:hypothetical protein